jgi:hypothetical protein
MTTSWRRHVAFILCHSLNEGVVSAVLGTLLTATLSEEVGSYAAMRLWAAALVDENRLVIG